jgi:hypothetical protein
MSSKRDDMRAFNKLCKAFPKQYCSLDLDIVRYATDGEVRITYTAYVGTEGNLTNYLSKAYNTPIEAVDECLRHFKKGEYCETN